MDVILLQKIENLGEASTIVTVKDGYGRNYLIPQKMAVEASKANLASLQQKIRQQAAKDAKVLAEMTALAEKLKSKTIRVAAKSGTSKKIFGSVTSTQLSAAIKEQLGVEIERKHITLTEEVKILGVYQATAKLHKKVEAGFTFEVYNDDAE